MSKKGIYTEMVGTRLTKEQKQYLEENEITIRDTVEYYIDNNTNETKKLKNRERYLVKLIKELEEQLTNANEELKEVKVKLGKTPEENQLTMDIATAKDRITNNCKIKNGGKINTRILANYMRSPEAERILETVIIEYSVKDTDKFIKEVHKSLGL